MRAKDCATSLISGDSLSFRIRSSADAKTFSRPIVTQIAPLRAFYPAEDYHQHYATLHPDSPYIAMYDLPKVAALKARYPSLYREDIAAR